MHNAYVTERHLSAEKEAGVSNARNNNFNFLRLLFASLVLLSHGPEITDGNRSRELLTRVFHTLSFGEVAVNCFFMLSGYLIVQSWQQTPDVWQFAKKRVRRIYPGFLFAFLLCVLVIAPFVTPSAGAYYAHLSFRAVVSMGLQLKDPTVPMVFPGTHYPVLNGSMWSIAYEARCYVIVALIGLIGLRWQKSIWLACLLGTLLLLPFNEQLSRVDFFGRTHLIIATHEFLRLLAFFSAGACFYLFRNIITLKGSWAAGAAVVLLVLLFQPQLASVGLATAGGYLLFWVAFASIPLLASFKRFDDVSYGIYLYGWPMQKLLNWYFPTVSVWLLIPIALVLAIGAGYASWHLIEAPFLKKKKVAAASN